MASVKGRQALRLQGWCVVTRPADAQNAAVAMEVMDWNFNSAGYVEGAVLVGTAASVVKICSPDAPPGTENEN